MNPETNLVNNIGPRERTKRRVMGIVFLVVGVGLIFSMIAYDAPRLLRAVVFFPLWMAGLGLLQARDGICIAHAARGTCNLDAGEAVIEDKPVVKELRLKARRVHRRALILAVAATAAAVAFP